MLTVVPHASIPAYEGPHAIPGIRFRAARQALGVSAWGMNVLELDPGCSGHPVHDHRHDGQEEVYVLLSGAAVLVVDGQEHPLSAGDLVRVPAEATRQIVTREQGATVLALGGTPGQAFAPTPGM
jgi:uncharacterized cupin superfamily protein